MRKETVEFTYYAFDELSDAAKDVARDWYREGALDYDWYDYILEDGKTIGLKIGDFDLDRGAYVKAEFMASAEETAHKIETEHGESCETFIDAKAYFLQRDAIVNAAEKDENGDFVDEYGLDNALDEIDKEFLHTLCEDYRIMLQKEMEYLLSDESVDETIRCNEYEFTEGGKRA